MTRCVVASVGMVPQPVRAVRARAVQQYDRSALAGLQHGGRHTVERQSPLGDREPGQQSFAGALERPASMAAWRAQRRNSGCRARWPWRPPVRSAGVSRTSNVRQEPRPALRGNHPIARIRDVGNVRQAERRQISLWSQAYAVAAAREGTSSLLRILLTCRSIVRSLRHSSPAMPLFV